MLKAMLEAFSGLLLNVKGYVGGYTVSYGGKIKSTNLSWVIVGLGWSLTKNILVRVIVEC